MLNVSVSLSLSCLLQSAANIVTKCVSFSLLQSEVNIVTFCGSSLLLQSAAKVVTKWGSCYKVRQIMLQSEAVVTKWVNCYKVGHNSTHTHHSATRYHSN